MNNPVDFAPDLLAFKKDWLPLEQAIQRVAKFEHDFGKAHLSLACHAALASILTPELVNLMRINFLENSVEWIAESNLLLSSLCFPIHQGIYEIEPQIRQVLLVVLQTDAQYGSERLAEIASLLYYYNESPLASRIPIHIKRIYQWISSAYLDPDATVQNMSDFLGNTELEEPASRTTNYQLVGKALAMLANPLEMTNLQVELEDLADSTYLVLQGYAGEANFSTLLQRNSYILDEGIQPLTSSVVDWLLSSTSASNGNTTAIPTDAAIIDRKDTPIADAKPITIFFCYARKDEELLNKLKGHLRPLQRQHLINIWYDREISAGTVWEEEIKLHLNEAQIILLLISPDFMNSAYCYGIEMQHAMQRHKEGGAHIIPILLRPTDMKGAPFEKLQMLPEDAKPVTQWLNEDDAFADITANISKILEERLNLQILPKTPGRQKHQVDIQPIEVFCCYTPEDEDKGWLRKLETQLSLLKRQGLISLWYDRLISPGTDWAKTIDAHVETASMIILLVSANFFASDYCYGIEMQRMLERSQNGEARVIPIILHPVDWQSAPFAHLQVLPTNARPLTAWHNVDDGLVDIAAGIRYAIEELPPQHTILPKFWNIPIPRNPFFSGREDILLRLHEQLNTGRATALSQAQALSGLGGIGKTQIAVEYVYRYRQEYQAVFWANASSQEALIASYTNIAGLLDLPERNEQEATIVIQAVKRWLQTHREWLFILDNADNLEILPTFLPSNPDGHLLITTCAAFVGELAHRIDITALSPEQSALLLLRRAGLLASDHQLDQATSEMREQAIQVVRELGGLPLALDQAGAYIEATSISLSQYLQLYSRYRKEMLNQRRGGGAGYPASVATTWSLSFANVELRNPGAADLLRLCAFLAPDNIPEKIFTQGASRLGSRLESIANDLLLLNQVVETLRAYSLLERDPQTRTFSVHRLVQTVLRDSMPQKDSKLWSERAICAVNEIFPEAEFAYWTECELYLPHALTCANWIEQEQMVFSEAALLLQKVGLYLRARAQYTEAELLFKQALRIHEQMPKSQHPDTAFTLNNLALLCEIQGKYTEAEPLFQRALLIQEQMLGPENPNTAITINNLANLYRDQGKYAEAEPLFQRALRLQEQGFGPKHPNTAVILKNLALLYENQGRYTEAEPLLLRALRIQEQVLGTEHPDTASSLNNLARLHLVQGKYTESESLLLRALRIQEQVLGTEHPDTAIGLNDLALLYESQGNHSAAEPLFQRALAIRERQLGPEHPDTATSLNNLAILYKNQGQYAEAEPLYKRALAIREQQLGSEHPDTAISLNNLALFYENQSRYEEAKPLLERALAIQEHILGPEHPHTTTTRKNHATLLRAIKQTNKTKSNKQTGPLDPRTLLRKRYVIVRAIGHSGMAAVYEARDTRRGTSCAIKEMSISTVPANERPQVIQNFLAEARILSRLNHPNLPAFTDFFTEGTRHFLVMEFVDGNTLEELLEANHGPFSERRVLGWARQLCDVLEYLHSQQPPIIFHDLKPGNIMLTRTGRIKLVDFGIARIFRSSGSQDTQLLGTPGFAPPEQYGSAQTDERSDIYSLAMTLFQLMTDAVNETSFGLKDVHFSYPHISSPVARALEKATSLKPEDRYESIVVFRRALLGIGTFRFENGREAATPDELADLCSHYPEEAADYLFAEEIESWLQEIGKDEMARAVKHIRATVGDPDMAVERLLQTLTGTDDRSRGIRSGRAQELATVVVDPKTIDFGQVYPGLSAPILLTISGARGALVSGTLRPVESWIVLDQTTFDGTRNPINVRVDSTRLRGATHYTGTIMVIPNERYRELAVTIEVDVLGYTTRLIADKAT